MSNQPHHSRNKGWCQGYHRSCNSLKIHPGDPDTIFTNYSSNYDNGDGFEELVSCSTTNVETKPSLTLNSPPIVKVRLDCNNIYSLCFY